MASERRNMFYENKKEETTEMQHEPRDAHHDVVDLDLSLKMFGADKGWYNYHSTEDKLNWDVLFDQGWGYVDHSINRAKHLKVDHSRHLTWLDGEIAYPTSLGLPMKLKMLASEAIKVGLEGKFDLPAIVRDPDNADVGIKVLAR
ncbi:hypothetical protein AAG570_004638 [Ranatra chinensis]|uniref:Vitellinogen open beta-sheet domain-containing protein n=1 Tax=Ranatra chinensis TaxID=642074 RepID=A0ABD0Y276_9HEMI